MIDARAVSRGMRHLGYTEYTIRVRGDDDVTIETHDETPLIHSLDEIMDAAAVVDQRPEPVSQEAVLDDLIKFVANQPDAPDSVKQHAAERQRKEDKPL